MFWVFQFLVGLDAIGDEDAFGARGLSTGMSLKLHDRMWCF